MYIFLTCFLLCFYYWIQLLSAKLIKSHNSKEVYVLDDDKIKHLIYGMDQLVALGYDLSDIHTISEATLNEYSTGADPVLEIIDDAMKAKYSKSSIESHSNTQQHTHSKLKKKTTIIDKDIVLYYVGLSTRLTTYKYNGDTIRKPSGQGISGSDSSAIGTMEALANYHSNRSIDPFEYYLLSTGAEHGAVTNNVHYISHLSDQLAEHVTIIIMVSYENLSEEFVRKCSQLRHVIQVGECLRIATSFNVCNIMVKELGIRLHYVHLSQWDKKYAFASQLDKRVLDLISPSDHHIIPNPVFWDLIDSMVADNYQQLVSDDRKDYIFHASFERGGEVSARIFCGVQESNSTGGKFYSFDYHHGNGLHVGTKCEGISNMGSMSKPELYRHLGTTKYFLYMLVLPRSAVHKDTFAVSVLEAIMLGVRVVTLHAATFYELYGRYDLVDFFPISNPLVEAHIQDTNFDTNEPYLISQEFVDSCISYIKELDKEDFTEERKRRMMLARKLYNPESFAKPWQHLIFDNLIA